MRSEDGPPGGAPRGRHSAVLRAPGGLRLAVTARILGWGGGTVVLVAGAGRTWEAAK